MSKVYKQEVGVARKKLITTYDKKNHVLRYSIVQPIIPNPRSMSYCRSHEYQVNFKIFHKINKVDFFKRLVT